MNHHFIKLAKAVKLELSLPQYLSFSHVTLCLLLNRNFKRFSRSPSWSHWVGYVLMEFSVWTTTTAHLTAIMVVARSV